MNDIDFNLITFKFSDNLDQSNKLIVNIPTSELYFETLYYEKIILNYWCYIDKYNYSEILFNNNIKITFYVKNNNNLYTLLLYNTTDINKKKLLYSIIVGHKKLLYHINSIYELTMIYISRK